MIPEFGFAAKAAQLIIDSAKSKVVVLGLLHDGFVQFETLVCTVGRLLEISQPLLPIGIKTPIFI
jgi:hypothetical protein